MNDDLDRIAREVAPCAEARAAADHAACATVYAQGGAAAADRDAFTTGFQWQVRQLAALAATETACAPSP